MDAKIIVALIGLAGISLGALLSGIGYFSKVRAERLKNRKNVLFHLLEIRASIKTEYLDPQELMEEYINSCQNHLGKLGVTDADPASKEIKELIKNHFLNILQAMKPSLDELFINSFEGSILKLSLEAPLLAYKLRGRATNLRDIISSQNKYIEEFNSSEEVKKLENLSHVVSQQMTKMNYSVIEDILLDLNVDIKRISWDCGLRTWWQCRPILKDTSKPEINFDGDEISNAMNMFFQSLAEEIEKQKTQET